MYIIKKVKFTLSKFLNIVIFTCLFCFLFKIQAVAQNSITVYHDIYVFHYDAADSVLIKKLIKKIDPEITKLENFFGEKSKIDIHIYLTKSQSEFLLYARNGIPEWAQAVTISDKRLIIIRAQTAEEIQRLPQVLLHELVHVYIGIISPRKRIPTWLHEGIAQYLSNENLTINEEILIANALYSNRISYLEDLDSMLTFSPLKARLGYALARSAIDYFVRQYNLKILLHTIKALNNNNLNEAFKQNTGRDFVDFETGWFAYIDEKYSWMFLLNAENIVWILFVLLFFAALIKIKISNRKTINSWDNDMDIRELN